MAHIDASLRLLAPSADPTKLPRKRFQPRVKLFRPGDLGRLILVALRRARQPLGTHDIAAAIEAANGYGTGTLSARVQGNLAYLVQTGRVAKIGRGKAVLWSLNGRHRHLADSQNPD